MSTAHTSQWGFERLNNRNPRLTGSFQTAALLSLGRNDAYGLAEARARILLFDYDIKIVMAGADAGASVAALPTSGVRANLIVLNDTIFVVDASRAGEPRLQTAADELAALAADEQLADAAVVVLANRCDAPGALPEAQLLARLGLERSLKGHPWRLQLCDALSGKGLDAGLGFLADTMTEL